MSRSRPAKRAKRTTARRTSRRRYLVSYDIANDKRRTQIFNELTAIGDRVQFSVFFCHLNPRERASLVATLDGIVHKGEDQVIILDLGPESDWDENRIRTIGLKFEPPTRVRVV